MGQKFLSSTNRHNAEKRHIADYYVTPVKDIITFLGALDEEVSLDIWDKTILDPCAGGDPSHDMSYPKALREYYAIPDDWNGIKTIDIREDSLAETKCNYIETKLDYKPFLVISNPPFNQAMEFIKKALDDVEDGGYVAMLLRLNFLETKARKDFFDNYMPTWIFVHHKRMSFTDAGGTDSVAYCHMVWKKNNYPKFAKIRVI